jgi:2-polyprenyl-3-methyl-5-hydroxy-6-metoxy-1,4-benzoquinol methylase
VTAATSTDRCLLCGHDRFVTLFPSTLSTADAPLRPEDFACTNIGHKEHGPVVKCAHCGLAFIHPREDPSQIVQAYEQVTDELYAEEEHGRVLTFTRFLNHVERFRKPPGKLLDVGCHIGTFLRLARERSWEPYGIEPSRWAVEYARSKQGLNVRQGVAKDAQDFAVKFDLITLIDVIEHVADPLQELKDIRAILAPDGMFVLTTMDFGSLFARITGKRWPWLMRMHLFYFTRDTMKKTLEAAGFETMHFSGYTHVVSFGYLIHKLASYSRAIARVARAIAKPLRLDDVQVPINFGDFMTVVARPSRPSVHPKLD